MSEGFEPPATEAAQTATAIGEAFARQAVASWGFTDGADLVPYELTENWTFRVSQPGGPEPIVLRIYRPAVKSLKEVRSELAWMTALRDEAGLPVPAVIDTVEGQQLIELRGDTSHAPRPGSHLYCVAFAWTPGREPPDDELPRWFPRLGVMMARMHMHARSWSRPPWFTRMRWDLQTTLGPQGHWGPWKASVHDPEERRQMAVLAEVVSSRLSRFGTAPERFGLVHADLRLANVLVEADHLTILDFDDCGDSWYLYDLASALTFNESRPDVDDLIAAWVDAYRSVTPLPAEDEAEIKTFLMLRRLMLSSYVGLRSDTELARELAEAGFSGETCRLAEEYLSNHQRRT